MIADFEETEAARGTGTEASDGRARQTAGTGGDAGLAFRCFLAAAKKGVGDAAFNVGVCYARGVGVEEDQRRANLWLERAAAPLAAPRRASPRDGAGAARAEGAAGGGDPRAQLLLAQRLSVHPCPRPPVPCPHALPDPDSGRCVVGGGLSARRRRLPCRAQEGRGCQADSAAAEMWLWRAAEGGEPRAMFNVGVLLASGRGGRGRGLRAADDDAPKEHALSAQVRRARQSAHAEEGRAAQPVAEESAGGSPDLEEAQRCAPGARSPETARRARSVGAARSAARAAFVRRWFRRAADLGHPRAAFNLARIVQQACFPPALVPPRRRATTPQRRRVPPPRAAAARADGGAAGRPRARRAARRGRCCERQRRGVTPRRNICSPRGCSARGGARSGTRRRLACAPARARGRAAGRGGARRWCSCSRLQRGRVCTAPMSPSSAAAPAAKLLWRLEVVAAERGAAAGHAKALYALGLRALEGRLGSRRDLQLAAQANHALSPSTPASSGAGVGTPLPSHSPAALGARRARVGASRGQAGGWRAG